MLRAIIDAFLAIRRAAGFKLRAEGQLLHHFAQWAADHGETHVRIITATEWAAAARNPWQRERRLQVIAGFARYARAEDSRHESPPTGVFAGRRPRPIPYIYSSDEVRSLLNAASQLASTWPLRPEIFTALIGLLASTGLRISEALALRFADVTSDGLLIRKTKFNKSRIVPLHPTTELAMGTYLDIRRRGSAKSDFIFISPNGNKLSDSTARHTFRRLVNQTSIGSVEKTPAPRIHSLRHTFASRVLETAPQPGSAAGWRVRALSTYLGHANIADTCWYLHATPQLMRGVADACERLLEGGAQ
jgi:site-specific recombinase XerD